MDSLLKLAERIAPAPPYDTIKTYLGPADSLFLGHAVDERVRLYAASGGVVSALLLYLLDQGAVQGAILSKTVTDDEGISARPFLACSREDVLSGQSSIYMEFPWLRGVRTLLMRSSGRLAIVGLPCHITALRRLERNHPQISERLLVRIALVCGRSSSKSLLLGVLAQKGIAESDVEAIRFREGHWRGKMHVWLKGGSECEFPFNEFSLYRNLHFHCEKKCLACDDILGESADLVCGDAWLHELRDEPVKQTLVLCRTPDATAWMKQMAACNVIATRPITPETAFQAQRRGLLPAKRGKQAKAILGKYAGYRIPQAETWRSRWNDYLAAAMILFNYRWTESRHLARLILRLPKPLLRFNLIILSLLKQL